MLQSSKSETLYKNPISADYFFHKSLAMLLPQYIEGPGTCRKRDNLNHDRVVFNVSFDVDLMKTLNLS